MLPPLASAHSQESFFFAALQAHLRAIVGPCLYAWRSLGGWESWAVASLPVLQLSMRESLHDRPLSQVRAFQPKEEKFVWRPLEQSTQEMPMNFHGATVDHGGT